MARSASYGFENRPRVRSRARCAGRSKAADYVTPWERAAAPFILCIVAVFWCLTLQGCHGERAPKTVTTETAASGAETATDAFPARTRMMFIQGSVRQSTSAGQGYFNVEAHDDALKKIVMYRMVRRDELQGQNREPVDGDLLPRTHYYLSEIAKGEKGDLVAVLKHRESREEIRLPQGKWVPPSIQLPTAGQEERKEAREAAPAAPGVIYAKIVAAKDNKLVVISAGSDDKVEEGMVFIVYRGDKYLGDVKVVNVYKDMSGAEIIYTVSGQEIKEGDDAKTKQLL